MAVLDACLAGQKIGGVARRRQIEREAAGGDVAPVGLARVRQQKMHVDMFLQRVEQPQMIRRERDQAETVEPVRAVGDHTRLQIRVVTEARDEIGEHAGAVAASEPVGVREPAPDPGLPAARVVGRRFAVFPAREHVRPVDEILVEDVGELACELVAAHFVHGIAEIVGDGGYFGGHRGQCGIEMPGQAVGLEMRTGRGVIADRAQHVPDPAAGQCDVEIGGNAFAFGELDRQPAPDAGVGREHGVDRQRRDATGRRGVLAQRAEQFGKPR